MDKPITVKQLIKFLSKQDPQSVVYYDYGGSTMPLTKDELESVFEFEEE